MKFLILPAVLIFSSLAPAYAAEPVMEIAKLERMAESARSATEHSEVSKQYRLRAEHFEAKATQHEEQARKMESRPRTALEHKWPGMSRQPWVKERQLAMHARRAASESYSLADRHMRLSVEALAEGGQVAGRAADRETERSRQAESRSDQQESSTETGR